MKRQGLNVTIGQLRRVADTLEKELKETYAEANCEYPTYAATNQQLHIINIINEFEELSDTWHIEEGSQSVQNASLGGNNDIEPNNL